MSVARMRRFFRFTLRSMLVLTTGIAVIMGMKVSQANKQRAAVAWIAKMNGTVRYDYEYDTKERFIANTAPSTRRWLSDLIGADYFFTVVEVYLHGPLRSDLAPLADLPELKGVFLIATDVDDISVLSRLGHLKWLDVQYSSAISDVTPLANLRQLESLCLTDTNVSDVSALAHLTELETLVLSGTKVDDVSPLSHLAELKYLDLEKTPVRRISCLAALKRLEELWLNKTQAAAEEVSQLRAVLPRCRIAR